MIAYFCLYLENFYLFRVGWFVPFRFSVNMRGLCRAGVSRFEKQILPREVVDLGVVRPPSDIGGLSPILQIYLSRQTADLGGKVALPY